MLIPLLFLLALLLLIVAAFPVSSRIGLFPAGAACALLAYLLANNVLPVPAAHVLIAVVIVVVALWVIVFHSRTPPPA